MYMYIVNYTICSTCVHVQLIAQKHVDEIT